HAKGQVDALIDTLTSGGTSDGASGGGLERERALVAALIAEAAGQRDRMAAELQRASGANPADEAAVRMSMVVADNFNAAMALVRYGEAVDDSVRAALAFTEAGLRLMEEEGHEADGEALLRRAAEVEPELPIPAFIGMYIAGALVDLEGQRRWLEDRRRLATNPVSAVGDTLRLAMQMGPDETAERASFLEEAHRALPADYTLRDLYEQATLVSEDRAAWLSDRIDEGTGGAAMALEAALAFELDGDMEQAARAVHKAIQTAPDDKIARLFAQRYAALGLGSGPMIEELESQLRLATNQVDRTEAAEALAQVEADGRGDHRRAAEVLASVATGDEVPLSVLHRIQSLAFQDPAIEGLAGVALKLASALDGASAAGQASLAARLLLAEGGWAKAYEALRVGARQEGAGPWLRRNLAVLASQRGDYATAAGLFQELAESETRALDQATLLVRASEALSQVGDAEAAGSMLGSALDVVPRHMVALLQRAEQLERIGDVEGAATAFEELAMACSTPEQRAGKLYQAAALWLSLDTAAGNDEGRRLLEGVSAIDPDFGDTFERLQAIYLAAGAKRELADLLGARLDTVDDPDERVRLEVLRGKMLVEAGSAGEARDALAAALEANPDNAEALSAYADVCAAEEDWEAVEQSILRLGRLVSDPAQQTDIYLRLGKLYHEHLPNPERAEMAYLDVLKRAPDHVGAREALVSLHLDDGDTNKAFEQQNALVAGAKSHADKCRHTVRLAEIHEAAGDLKEAEQVLVKARRSWNKEPGPVIALYRFYKRTGQEPAADLLLDRAAAEVRRGLGAGRFEAPLFALAKMVAEMRDQADAAVIADSTLGAIEGRSARLEGAGDRAGESSLDEHTAPEIFTEPFRQMLEATGYLLDLAAPFDIGSLRAKPLPPNEAAAADRILEIAAGYGLVDVNVVATNALGRVVIPAHCSPPSLVFGLQLITSEREDVREFLVHRACKALQTRTAAFARTAPIDLWPLLGAYLKVHSPSFEPQGVDTAKVAAFYQAMAPHAPKFGPQMSLLASEVISSIGNRASSLNTASNAWGSRTALLASGDPNLALEAIAWAAGNSQGPPGAGPERVRWIGRQAEARDLIVFSIGDGYAAARAALGLSTSTILPSATPAAAPSYEVGHEEVERPAMDSIPESEEGEVIDDIEFLEEDFD
ncbi:MAG: hypothetical protein KC731_22855, partial [Myxococcales bacterium]|nr:hypothetical protein [Myxococcales bacterium]